MRNLFSLYILKFQVFCIDGLFFGSLEKIFHYSLWIFIILKYFHLLEVPNL